MAQNFSIEELKRAHKIFYGNFYDEDNEFKKPIFIPTTVKNSAIIYNGRENFFHGFDIIKKKTLRKALSFQLVKN